MIEAVTAVDWSQWILPAALLVGGVVLGLALEYGAMRRVRARVEKTRWNWDDLLVDAVRGMVFLWGAVAGVYASRQAATQVATLPEIVGTAVDKLVVVALGLSFTVVAARLAAAAIRGWTKTTEGALPSTSLLQNVARIIVFVLGAFLILQNLGIEVGALVASLGIGGLAVALALQDTLSNLFAGFQIILARQVRNGDYVRLDTGEEGYVTDIKWRNTTIKSRIDDHEVVVPNSKLANAIVTNFDLPSRPFWVRIEVGVGYDSDLDRVEEVTLDVAREVMEAFELEDMPEPVLRYQGFGDSAVTFRLRLRVDDYSRQFPVRHELVKRVHARYREEGIEIPFPIRTVYAPKGVDVRQEEGAAGRVEGAGAPGGARDDERPDEEG